MIFRTMRLSLVLQLLLTRRGDLGIVPLMRIYAVTLVGSWREFCLVCNHIIMLSLGLSNDSCLTWLNKDDSWKVLCFVTGLFYLSSKKNANMYPLDILDACAYLRHVKGCRFHPTIVAGELIGIMPAFFRASHVFSRPIQCVARCHALVAHGLNRQGLSSGFCILYCD